MKPQPLPETDSLSSVDLALVSDSEEDEISQPKMDAIDKAPSKTKQASQVKADQLEKENQDLKDQIQQLKNQLDSLQETLKQSQESHQSALKKLEIDLTLNQSQALKEAEEQHTAKLNAAKLEYEAKLSQQEKNYQLKMDVLKETHQGAEKLNQLVGQIESTNETIEKLKQGMADQLAERENSLNQKEQHVIRMQQQLLLDATGLEAKKIEVNNRNLV